MFKKVLNRISQETGNGLDVFLGLNPDIEATVHTNVTDSIVRNSSSNLNYM